MRKNIYFKSIIIIIIIIIIIPNKKNSYTEFINNNHMNSFNVNN